ncbi:hypothetical protein [Actinoplanes aureus]|nr:hypothetical protein [Actinoplanes aureus]
MGFDASRFVVGAEWVYRARDDGVSEWVRIRAVAEFLDVDVDQITG